MEVADQILRFFLDLDVAVADDAEGAVALHFVSGEEQRGEPADQRLDRDIARRLARKPHEARQGRRDHQQLANRLPIGQPLEIEDETEALVRDEREWMRRIERLRRQHGQHLLAEMRLQPLRCPRIDAVVGQDMKILFRQLATQRLPYDLLAAHQRVGALTERCELLRGRQTIGGELLDIVELLPAQARNADHEELVEIIPRDRQETKPLQ